MSILKLLIIDDEPGIRSGITRILKDYKVDYPFLNEEFAFDITEADTGEKGLDIIRNDKPDIVLLDNKLPGMSGIELLETIRKDHLDVYVMMITSFASLDLAVRATRNGAYNFIPKPFTPNELRAAINDLSKHLFLKKITKQMQESGKEVRFQFLTHSNIQYESHPVHKYPHKYYNPYRQKVLFDNWQHSLAVAL